MANIKISELNSLSKKDYEDLVPIVDISANETKKISIEELVDNNVNLIAVSSTAPLECSTGDKYYNTTTNLIYTATATDTWGGTGEEAVEGIMYIVFEDQVTYAYNGETLVSVGGGAGTYVGDVPPEDPKENDLWVDTSDEEHLAEVDDEVSTTSTNAVQNQAITNYVNDFHTYSTTERVVGTWIDNKPIYRKVFTGSWSSAQGTINLVDNVAQIVRFEPIFKRANSSYYYTDAYYVSSTDRLQFYFNPSGTMMRLGYSCGSDYPSANGDYTIIFEYTKTTD